jgi:signal transduction histidine kinase
MVTDAQLLAQGYLGDLTAPQTAKVESIAHKGELLLGLVREYLDLDRVDGGDPQPRFRSRVNVNEEIIKEAVGLVRPQMDARGMHLAQELPDPPPLVCCDATLLRIVLVNLLDNAVKYGAENGAIRLTVALTPARGGTSARLSVGVWNQGPGFSPAERNKLFRRFSRLDDPELRTRPGTGVGLYSAWRIVQLHRGRFTAESERGEWARFSFDVPAAPECSELTGLGAESIVDTSANDQPSLEED